MNDRHAKILDLVNEQKKIEVNRLSELFEVSKVTIRKDLDALEEKGLLAREHGFAICKNSDDINNRLALRYERKRKIAEKAAEMVANGETVMIESGSSCTLLAELLAKTKKDVTIITNSAFIASYIRAEGNVRIVLLGGEYQKESQAMVGPLLKKYAGEFYVDKFFAGTDGFLAEMGFTGGDMMRAEAIQNMAASAKNVILLTDSSKFKKQGVVLEFRFNEIAQVITDVEIGKAEREILERHGIRVTALE